MRRLLLSTLIALSTATAMAGPAAADGVDGADDELTIAHASPLSASPGTDLHLDVAVTSTCRATSWLLVECSAIDVSVVYEEGGEWRTVSASLDDAGGHAALTIPGWDVTETELRYLIVATQEQCEPLDWSRPCRHLAEQTGLYTVAVR